LEETNVDFEGSEDEWETDEALDDIVRAALLHLAHLRPDEFTHDMVLAPQTKCICGKHISRNATRKQEVIATWRRTREKPRNEKGQPTTNDNKPKKKEI